MLLCPENVKLLQLSHAMVSTSYSELPSHIQTSKHQLHEASGRVLMVEKKALQVWNNVSHPSLADPKYSFLTLESPLHVSPRLLAILPVCSNRFTIWKYQTSRRIWSVNQLTDPWSWLDMCMRLWTKESQSLLIMYMYRYIVLA